MARFESTITKRNVSYYMVFASTTKNTSRAYNAQGDLEIAHMGKGVYSLDNYNMTHSTTGYVDTYGHGYTTYKIEDMPNNNYYISMGHYSDYSQTGQMKLYQLWFE